MYASVIILVIRVFVKGAGQAASKAVFDSV